MQEKKKTDFLFRQFFEILLATFVLRQLNKTLDLRNRIQNDLRNIKTLLFEFKKNYYLFDYLSTEKKKQTNKTGGQRNTQAFSVNQLTKNKLTDKATATNTRLCSLAG